MKVQRIKTTTNMDARMPACNAALGDKSNNSTALPHNNPSGQSNSAIALT
jgi:hypothetical protein